MRFPSLATDPQPARAVRITLIIVAAIFFYSCEGDPSSPAPEGGPTAASGSLAPLAAELAPEAGFSDWGTPEDAGPDVNASGSELSPAFGPDGLSLYFASARGGGEGGWDIWVSRRASSCDAFGPPLNLGPAINTSEREQGAFVSRDGQLLFFTRGDALMTAVDIYVSHRTDPLDDLAWSSPVRLGAAVNSPAVETEPWIVAGNEPAVGGDDGAGGAAAAYLYFGRGPGNVLQDFYAAPIDRSGLILGPAVPVSELNAPAAPPLGNEDGLTIRNDAREVIFASRRFATGGAELFVSTRRDRGSAWGTPERITVLNSPRPDLHPALSADGASLAFSSARKGPGDFRIFLSTRTRGAGAASGPCSAAETHP